MAELGAALNGPEVAEFLANLPAQFPGMHEIHLMRFADYFKTAFAKADAVVGGVLRTSTPPTLNLLLLFRASV